MLIRDAIAQDAEQACEVMRRSIVELCFADHRGDPAILERWLANKKPEIVRGWIDSANGSILVAETRGEILAVGGVTDDGEITLNYVSPDARHRGVSKAMLRALEARAKERGNTHCRLQSTQTAHGFYLAAGYRDDGPPENKVGAPCQPMRKDL